MIYLMLSVTSRNIPTVTSDDKNEVHAPHAGYHDNHDDGEDVHHALGVVVVF